MYPSLEILIMCAAVEASLWAGEVLYWRGVISPFLGQAGFAEPLLNYESGEQGSLSPLFGKRWMITDSRRKCLFFLEHMGWTQRTNAGSGFRRPLLLRKTWGLRCACGLKTREGFGWFLCFPPTLYSEPFKGTFFLIFAFPLWVLYNTDNK